MASSIINSDDGVISGTSGLKSTGGDDGVLVFQSKGTETARINTDKQIVAAAGTASLPIYSTTGDLNTGIYFPAADTIGFVCGGTEDFRVDGTGQLWNTVESEVGTDYTTLYKGYLCRAWVFFTVPSGTPTISASGNISSITDNGVGDYIFNFTNSMPDTNYCAVGMGTGGGANYQIFGGNQTVGARNTGSLQLPFGFVTSTGGGLTNQDPTSGNVAIFR